MFTKALNHLSYIFEILGGVRYDEKSMFTRRTFFREAGRLGTGGVRSSKNVKFQIRITFLAITIK